MKLLTAEIEKALQKSPIGSTDGQGLDADVIVKYFDPCGAGTWLITEGEKQENDDWLLYGYCYISVWEWGYVSLSELQKYKGKLGLGIERDIYASGTVKENLE